METLNLSDVVQYVEENIGTFHQKRIASLQELKLGDVLKKKNPYLF
nr:cytosolic protein [Segetibacter sp.]